MMAGVKPLELTLLPTLYATPSCLSVPAPPVGISITLPLVALCHSSATIAGTSTETQLGAHTALPQTLPIKVKKSIGWSHQTLKLGKVV